MYVWRWMGSAWPEALRRHHTKAASNMFIPCLGFLTCPSIPLPISIRVPLLYTIVITVVTAPKLLLLLETLQVMVTGLWVWFLHLFQQHAKWATVHNGHLDSPHFSLLGNTQADFSDLFIIQGRHAKMPFCTWNQGPLSYKTVSISLCNCDGSNSNLAFHPQENREGWARGSLQNSTLSLDVVWKDVALKHMASRGVGKFPVWQQALGTTGR